MAGAKSEPGKNNYAGCQHAAALVPKHSHASANRTTYTDFPQNQSESQKKSFNLRVSADRCRLEHQQTVPRPSTAWLHAKQRNKVYPGLITFEFFFGDWARQAKVKLHHHDCVALHLHRTEHSHKSRLSAAMTLPPPHNEQILSKVP